MPSPPPPCSHVATLFSPAATLPYVSPPRLRLTDVPVLLRGWPAERVAHGPPREPCGRRRLARVRRGERRDARRTHHAVGCRHLVGAPCESLGAERGGHSRAGGGSRDPARACGTQGIDEQALARRQAAPRQRRRVDDAG